MVPIRAPEEPSCNSCVVADLSCNCEACSLDAPGGVSPDTAPDDRNPTDHLQTHMQPLGATYAKHF